MLQQSFEINSLKVFIVKMAGLNSSNLHRPIFMESLLKVDLIVCTGAIILMTIPQIAGNELTYAVTAIYGLGMATVYGSGVSMIATYMNVSGKLHSNIRFDP